MIIGMTGGRNYDDDSEVRQRLRPFAEPGNLLVEGGATGADELAYLIWTQEFQLPAVTVPARWGEHNREAGPLRNIIMAKGLWMIGEPRPLDLLIPFPGGRGTANMRAVAQKNKIPFDVHRGYNVYGDGGVTTDRRSRTPRDGA